VPRPEAGEEAGMRVVEDMVIALKERVFGVLRTED